MMELSGRAGREPQHRDGKILPMSESIPKGAGLDVPEVMPVPASSTILLRDGAPFDVLLVRRHDSSSFVPSAWVFPGGAVDEVDRQMAEDEQVLSIMKVCAHRELFEETAIWLGSSPGDPIGARERMQSKQASYASLLAEAAFDREALIPTSRWITPRGIPKRFDTWFFLVHVDPDVQVLVDGREIVEAIWLDPREALDRHGRGTMPMVLPTVRNLEALLEHASIDSLLESRRGASITAVEPVIVERDGRKRIVVPGEEG